VLIQIDGGGRPGTIDPGICLRATAFTSTSHALRVPRATAERLRRSNHHISLTLWVLTAIPERLATSDHHVTLGGGIPGEDQSSKRPSRLRDLRVSEGGDDRASAERPAPHRRRQAPGVALMTPFERHLRAVDGTPAVRARRARACSPREQASKLQRMRILSAMVQVASVQGVESATVARVIGVAGVSRRTFYDIFEDRSDCLRAVFEEAVAIAAERASGAYDTEARWVDRVRAGLIALLELLEEEPEVARLCVAHALGRPATLSRRGEVLDQLTRIIDEGRSAARASRQPPPLAAQVVLGGVLGLTYARLLGRDPRALVDVLNPLMFMIVLPYLGEAAALRELSRPVPARASVPRELRGAPDPLEGLDIRPTYRTLRVLAVIAAQPGLSNREVSERAGITDQGQISKLLARLARLGLMENTGQGQARGLSNAWRLTRRGQAVERAIGRESLSSQRSGTRKGAAPR
jgi:AcrR family transcriptional regulator